MTSSNESIGLAEAQQQVHALARRLAMLHYHYASTIVRHLGAERGREVIAEAIKDYGTEVGARQRAKVVAAGYEPSVENYDRLPDVPSLFLDRERTPACPMAQYWVETGQQALGRLYCYVDQAKYAAFDPECECRHLQNVLDGDPTCEIVAKKRADWAGR